MLGYRLIVSCEPNSHLSWNITFEDKNSDYGNADTENILFSMAREFVTALSNLRNRKKGKNMLGYRLIINHDTDGSLSWNISFEDTKSNSHADTDEVSSVMNEFITALEKLEFIITLEQSNG